MSETCPTCGGAWVPDVASRLMAYEHRSACPVAAAEADQLRRDHRRPNRRYRAATDAERVLIRASGVVLDRGTACMTHVTWPTPTTRHRSWRGLPVVATDDVTERTNHRAEPNR